MRHILAVMVVVSASAAQASFELMYIPQPFSDRVLRYDPFNRVQLGSIAHESITSVAYRGGQYGVLRSAGAGNIRHNMYSGFGVSQISGSAPSGMSQDGGTVLSANGLSITAATLSTGSTAVIAVGGSITPISLVRLASGSYAGFGYSGTSLYSMRISASGGTVSSSAILSGVTRNANSAAILSTDASGQLWVQTLVRTTTAQELLSSRIDANGFALESNSLGLANLSLNYTCMLAPAHLGFYVVGADATTDTLTRFRHYVGSSPTLLNTWTENFDSRNSSTVASMGMVVAPEPGTMIALGAGVATLLRRRRRA